MRKRLIHTVELEFFRDPANGEYGVAHRDTINDDFGGFNAFWGGVGILHDVFEHWFENKHKYFLGNNAQNVGGEIAAMGACYYYAYELGAQCRNSNYDNRGSIMRSTTGEIFEAISSGWCHYGHTLECGVPYQEPTTECFEQFINEYYKSILPKRNSAIRSKVDTDEANYGKEYAKSVTLSKVQRLYRWGFRMAERLIPDTSDNCYMLDAFCKYLNIFCKNNSAEDLATKYKYMTVKLYKDKHGDVSWRIILNGGEKGKNIILKQGDGKEMQSFIKSY
jgi:hypothetical protein